MDDPTTVCLCAEFSDTKFLASTGESASDGVDISRGAGDTCIVELVTDIETGVWISWSSGHVEPVLVGDCYFTAFIHFHHQIRWCLEWILNAGIC